MRTRTAIAAALSLNALPAVIPMRPSLGRYFGVQTRFNSLDAVALTFDDGPHPEGTVAVLSQLSQYGSKATFFLVGEQVRRYPALAAEIVTAGHEVALHCDRHRNLLRLTPKQIENDLKCAAASIEDAIGISPRLYRPPYGILSLAGLPVVQKYRWKPLLWSHWGRDWSTKATPTSIASLATKDIQAGDVILLHDADYYSAADSWKRTVASLPSIFYGLEQSGLTVDLL